MQLNSMEHVIEEIKEFCQREKFTEYDCVAAAARGILGGVKYFEPTRLYSIAEVCDLLEALHDIVYAGAEQKLRDIVHASVKQKEMP